MYNNMIIISVLIYVHVCLSNIYIYFNINNLQGKHQLFQLGWNGDCETNLLDAYNINMYNKYIIMIVYKFVMCSMIQGTL